MPFYDFVLKQKKKKELENCDDINKNRKIEN